MVIIKIVNVIIVVLYNMNVRDQECYMLLRSGSETDVVMLLVDASWVWPSAPRWSDLCNGGSRARCIRGKSSMRWTSRMLARLVKRALIRAGPAFAVVIPEFNSAKVSD